MDNFDNFIKDKSKEEKESFRLPKSFEDKVDFILENIDNEKSVDSHPWYRNRKFISIVACFAFGCFVLMKLVNRGEIISSKVDGSPKITNNIEAAEDSAYGLFSEEKLESSELYDQDNLSNGTSVILSLAGESTEVRDIQGDSSEFNSLMENRTANSEKDEEVQILVASKNENIKIEFSAQPTFYKVNLVGDKTEEYFSENLILKAPSEVGIYLFEIMAYWNNEEIKYTVKIEIKD